MSLSLLSSMLIFFFVDIVDGLAIVVVAVVVVDVVVVVVVVHIVAVAVVVVVFVVVVVTVVAVVDVVQVHWTTSARCWKLNFCLVIAANSSSSMTYKKMKY